MHDRIRDGSRLVAAMRHAVGAFLVVPGAVVVPVGLGHELLERGGVALGEEIARPLPAKDIPGRITPRRAAILLIAGEEIEIQRGMAELPGALASLAPAEDRPEQLLGL